MKSVMHVITGLGTGGAEVNLTRLATALQARGSRQHVVSLAGRGAFSNTLESAGVTVTDLDAHSAPQGLAGLVRLVGLINRQRPDVLQGWMYHGNLASLSAHCLSRGRGQRSLFWNLRASNMDTARYGLVIRASAMMSSLPDAVVSNSAAGFSFHEAQGLKPRRSVLIANGIDTGIYKPDAQVRAKVREELGISSQSVVAIVVARVDPMKDYDAFLSAMRRNPKVIAIVAGEGTQQLKAVSNVVALGRRDDASRLYLAADMVVVPSAFGEGFSNSLAEGMASGLVPVATDVGDARLIVGETGIIVPPRDAEALSDAIEQVAALALEEKVAKGAAARSRIVTNFGLARSIDAYAELYGL